MEELTKSGKYDFYDKTEFDATISDLHSHKSN